MSETDIAMDMPANPETPGDRLRQARIAAGFDKVVPAARAKRLHPQNLSDHENNRRKINAEQAALYSKAFEVSPAWLMFGEGKPTDNVEQHTELDSNVRMVPIVGEVRAGAFAEIQEDSVLGEVPVYLPQYDRAALFALTVAGPSMNKHYPEGSVVIAAPAAEAGVRDQDHVVVRRHRHNLVETTVKEVVQTKDGIELWPRSTDLAHQTPMNFTRAADSDDGIEIIGVVVASFMPRRPRDGVLLEI